MALADDIRTKQILLIVLTKNNYLAKLPEIIKAVNANSKKMCYVALNKPYSSVIKSLQASGISPDNYFFIDVLTKSVQRTSDAKNCEFVDSPSNFTDIGLAFTRAVKEEKCDNIFFDTISTLAIYQSTGDLIKFVQNLMTKSRVFNTKAVYLALKEDSAELIKDMTMFVDDVIEIK